MTLQIKLFGRFEVSRDGSLIDAWPRQKTQEVFKLLASERGRVFTQDQLIDALFPIHDPAKAINNLQKRISELRRVFEPDLRRGADSRFIRQAGGREQGYYFNSEIFCQIDTEEFQKCLDDARSEELAERWFNAMDYYRRALELYRDDFLKDESYAEWTIAPRERWREKYSRTLAKLAECYARLGQLLNAIECCDRLLVCKPYSESAFYQRMLYEYHSGSQIKATETYQDCVRSLKKHLNVEPSPETRQLHEKILRDRVPPLPRAIPNNLPQQLTSFIGREHEIQEIKQLLRKTRLLTLTGVGGCGKTRLGLQVVSQLLKEKEYADGVWWVELASLIDPNLVVQAIASAMGVQEEAKKALLTTVADFLHSKEVLLILDNCEHVIESCARISQELLKACLKLKIVATSREPLGILGEMDWQVLPLSTPAAEAAQSPSWEALREYESVALFAERARAGESKFQLTQENASAVAQICSHLDGIPLAIELAAARVRALSVEQIAARLDDRFKLLTGGNRAALPRHQTLYATMDWSYQLLSEKEQALLRRLSVFAGGWMLEAAEEVCSDISIKSNEVMELLTHLVDKSLVLVERRKEVSRYAFLETVRQYGAEKLREHGETEHARERHLDYFLKLAEKAEPELVGPKQKEWLDLLEREHGNLRAALTCTLEREGVKKGIRLAAAVGQFWDVRGHWAGGRDILVRLLAEVRVAPVLIQAKASQWLGVLAMRQGDHEQAKAIFEKILQMSQEAGNKKIKADALRRLGAISWEQSDYTAARSFLMESRAIYQQIGNKQGLAHSLKTLGLILHEQGDYTAAQNFYRRSLAIFQELGDKREIAGMLNNLGTLEQDQCSHTAAYILYRESLALMQELEEQRGIAIALNNLGEIEIARGDYKVAQEFLQRSLALRQTIGNKRGTSEALMNLGMVANGQGDYVLAQDLYQQSVVTFQTINDKFSIALNLEKFAHLAYAQNHLERAIRLFGAAEALREIIGSPIAPSDRPNYDRTISALRTTLGEETFAKHWAEGRSMTMEQAIAYALNENEDFSNDSPSTSLEQ